VSSLNWGGLHLLGGVTNHWCSGMLSTWKKATEFTGFCAKELVNSHIHILASCFNYTMDHATDFKIFGSTGSLGSMRSVNTIQQKTSSWHLNKC